MKARNVRVKVLYDNKDISTDLAPYLKSFEFNDVLSGEADDISFTLQDIKELWEGDWLPDKGATLKASLVSTNWESEGEKEMELGTFEIDEIGISGMPHEVNIKGVSIPENNQLRGTDRSRSWEKAKLSVIAKDIADGAGMELFYDVDDDKELDRAEQTEESDLAFLLRMCKDKGLSLKVSDNKIIIMDEYKLEQEEPAMTLDKESNRVLSYSLTSKTREIYVACHVKYQNEKQGQLIEYTFTPDKDKQGKTLQVNKQVDSVADAEKLAKKELRNKNKDEVKLSLNYVGNFSLQAGLTVTLEGFHSFNGKYLITKANHSIGSGYKTSLELRRCLDGY